MGVEEPDNHTPSAGNKRRIMVLAGCLLFCIVVIVGHNIPVTLYRMWNDHKSIAERVAEYGAAAHERIVPYFQKASVSYPPSQLILLAIKQERRLEVYGAGTDRRLRYVCEFPIVAMCGKLGPKLMEGDRQTPEGIYRIESLNPNSRFHLALRIGYPNGEDKSEAIKDGRSNLGKDIMIHGGESSIGCLAMGDRAAEDLFVLAADTGIDHLTVVLSPVDFRKQPDYKGEARQPGWMPARIEEIKKQMQQLPSPTESSRIL